jgi:hypothetical protein
MYEFILSSFNEVKYEKESNYPAIIYHLSNHQFKHMIFIKMFLGSFLYI